MKKMRKLIPAFAMLLVSAIMMSTASFAWFTMGSTADATGMQITATADSSLIISTSTTYEKFSVANNQAQVASQTQKLYPATHITENDSAETFTTLLKAPADTGKVDAGTGIYNGSEWVNATTSATGGNYIDYTVYLATAGQAMTGKDLYVTVKLPEGATEVTNYIHNAVTVDFWVATWNAETETANTIQYSNANVNLLTVDADAENAVELKIADNISIPLVVDNETDNTTSYVTVTMRVYFNGALEDANKTGYTYVRNQMITDTAAQFAVTFEAKDHPTQEPADPQG